MVMVASAVVRGSEPGRVRSRAEVRASLGECCGTSGPQVVIGYQIEFKPNSTSNQRQLVDKARQIDVSNKMADSRCQDDARVQKIRYFFASIAVTSTSLRRQILGNRMPLRYNYE